MEPDNINLQIDEATAQKEVFAKSLSSPFKRNRFSKKQLATFILIFAVVGGYILWKSFALSGTTYNLTSSLPDNGTISGTVNWSLNVSPAPYEVDFYIDGVKATKVAYTSPYQYNGDGSLDTTSLTNGKHVFQEVAIYDSKGGTVYNSAYAQNGATISASHSVTVSNNSLVLGVNTTGGVMASLTSDFKRGTDFTLNADGTLTSMSAYMDGLGGTTGTQSVRYAIFNTDGSGNPTTLLAATNSNSISSGAAASWLSLRFSSQVTLSAGKYLLAIQTGPTQGVARLAHSGTGQSPYGPADAFSDGLTSTWGTPLGSDNFQYSIYGLVNTGGSSGTSGGTSGGGSTAAASIFLSPTGSDSNGCSSSAPCLTMARAYSLAKAGSVVQLAAGTYGVQTLSSNNPSVTSSSPVTFVSSGAVIITHINLKGASNLTFKNMTFGDGSAGNQAWYQLYSSNTICDQCYIHGQLDIDGGDANGPNGTTNASFTNGTVGNYIARNGDPQIGGFRGPTFTNQAVPTNISFINESFHDIDSDNLTSHTECLQVLAVHGLTIKQSKFYNCNVHGNGSKNGIQFSGYDHSSGCTNESTCGTDNDYWNVTIENSMFNGGPVGSNQIAFGYDDQFGDFGDCRNWSVRNNSIIGAVLWGCNNGGQNGGKSAVVVTSNIFSIGSAGFLNSQCNATFSYNIYESGGTGCGGTNIRTGAVSYVNRSGMDLHLTAGSFGINIGNSSNYPPVDFDGHPRPVNVVDIGAGEQ